MKWESGELGCSPAWDAYWLWASLSVSVFLYKMGHSYLSTLPLGLLLKTLIGITQGPVTLKYLVWGRLTDFSL